jgi:hypothetical protein
METTRAALAAAVSDCEPVGGGWPDQPINTWSSLAFVAAGVALIVTANDRAERLVGMASLLTGAGSVMFHGAQGSFAEWLHDWSIAVLLLALLASAIPAMGRVAVAASAAALGLLFALADGTTEPVSIAVAAGVGVMVLGRRSEMRPRWLAAAVITAIAGVASTSLGRTGGPLCDPESLWQPHAAWHVLAAAALVLYAVARGWVGTGRRADGGG